MAGCVTVSTLVDQLTHWTQGYLLSTNNIQICWTPNLLPDVSKGMVAKEPDLLAVLHRGLAILEWCQVLEWTVDSHAEQRRLVRQVPVDVFGGGFLCCEPVIIVMFGLTNTALLELVAVPMIGNNYRWEDENTDFFTPVNPRFLQPLFL